MLTRCTKQGSDNSTEYRSEQDWREKSNTRYTKAAPDLDNATAFLENIGFCFARRRADSHLDAALPTIENITTLVIIPATVSNAVSV
ncbi:hypothetical protein GCM10028895_28300 [Pontibacter rugosus]